MSEEVINVNLYGGKPLFGGGREEPLEASIISCDMYDRCSFYQEGSCLNVRSLGGGYCEYGSVQNVRGYTSRAKKYLQFKEKWRNHEEYHKLFYPSRKLGLIDDKVVFPYPFVKIERTPKGNFVVKEDAMTTSIQFLDYDEFTTDLIYKLCKHKPQAIMGGEIKDYQKNIVPLFLSHLYEVLPSLYNKFVSDYPEFDKDIDYVGRKALLRTINPSIVESDVNSSKFNEKWYWDGEFLTYQEGFISQFHIIGLGNDYEIEELKIKPEDDLVVEITDNSQVNENTIFKD